ncbi:MAG TPA: ATP-binding protein [Bryobacteraceae bacterium]|nr:ATP-binding protein [Bryobacteraceae bacterium]
MRSLFGKILISAVGVVVLTLVILVIVAAMDVRFGSRREPPFAAMITIQLAEAIYAYETGGPDVLRHTLERFRQVTGGTGVLTDETGRDLVTGKDRSDLRELARRRPRRSPDGRGGPVGQRPGGPDFRRGGPQEDRSIFQLLFFRPQGPVIARSSPDGRYTYFLIPQRRSFLSWFVQPELHLAILLTLTVVCWAFARHLTTPVRQLQAAVHRFGHGDLKARVGSGRKDELGQLARAFDQMADRIVTLLSAERRLLLDISHELRSPLTRLSLAVELARSGGDLDKQLGRIQKEADRLNAMLTELLQVTRAEGDDTRMRSEPLAFEMLVHDIVMDVAIEAEQRGVKLEVDTLPGVMVSGDAELLRRAVENVIRNAVRYSPEGQGVVHISIEVSSGQVLLRVRDFGPGIPEEDRERIFDPFYRVETHRDRATGGVGLGLAIAKRAVQLHHGSIRASNSNPGLTVEIELPSLKLEPELQHH